MLRINCPHCGVRDEIEFRYKGEAVARPAPDAGEQAFVAYVYQRANPAGWHVEWWLHQAGCRRVLKVARHTVTHEIAWVGGPQDTPVLPEGATR
jgi:heterotetrameric sarcosine oxidase delta subunit